MINYVIFDLDDTLCDYAAAKALALDRLCTVPEMRGTDADKFRCIYSETEPLLFGQFLRKKITISEYRHRRFADVLERLDYRGNVDALSRKMNEKYMRAANTEIKLFGDTAECLTKLKMSGIHTAILTNGPADGLREKIARTGLNELVEKIYLCDEIGFAKPRGEVFGYAVSDMGADKKAVVMVGDSPEQDYIGARKFGIGAILLDRKGRFPDFDGTKIQTLDSLYDAIAPV